ncbi:hypothetical protein GALL_126250 [mine drainage metagenome]|uniref:DUF302 domain-containing protein n=1 Tax=mine drainage metagenome TaxID=410659 RepID=A0A1J5S9Y7_9ZZZZ
MNLQSATTHRVFSATRVQTILPLPFDETLRRLHTLVRRPRRLRLALLARWSPTRLRLHLERAAGDTGLMILGAVRHDVVVAALGGPPKARMLLIGNPLTALGLMQLHPEAGVYAPLRVMFHGGPGGTTVVTRDAPSSLLDSFDHPHFAAVGRELDRRLDALLARLVPAAAE